MSDDEHYWAGECLDYEPPDIPTFEVEEIFPARPPVVQIELTGLEGVPSAYVLKSGDTLAITMQGVIDFGSGPKAISFPVTLKATIG